MSFRGELLQFRHDAFRMISSDAKLEINSPPHPPKNFEVEEVSYRACVPRVLISEYANQKILEIFLLENTRMQRTTLSLLWVQTRENYQKCYVFHFWSRIDFQEFSRLSDATQSMQSVQVLKKTILFEMGWKAHEEQGRGIIQDGRTQTSSYELVSRKKVGEKLKSDLQLIKCDAPRSDIVNGNREQVGTSAENDKVMGLCGSSQDLRRLKNCRSSSTMKSTTDNHEVVRVTCKQSSVKPSKKIRRACGGSKSSIGTDVDSIRQSRKQKEGSTTLTSAKNTNTLQFSDMSFLDYTANYFKLISSREDTGVTYRESEDVCFCCRDGGNVILCDWKGKNKIPCPKVYHEECLGYTVPRNVRWLCPRHRCHLCGEMARFLCRFCVSSYCDEHMRKDMTCLGPASKEVSDCTYVLCVSCQENAQRVYEAGKISSELYASIIGTKHRTKRRRQRVLSRAPLKAHFLEIS